MIDEVGREVERAEVNGGRREEVGERLGRLDVGDGGGHRALVQTAAVEAVEAENRRVNFKLKRKKIFFVCLVEVLKVYRNTVATFDGDVAEELLLER